MKITRGKLGSDGVVIGDFMIIMLIKQRHFQLTNQLIKDMTKLAKEKTLCHVL